MKQNAHSSCCDCVYAVGTRLKACAVGSGEMPHQLSALVPPEDPDQFPTPTWWSDSEAPVPGDPKPFWAPWHFVNVSAEIHAD